MVIRQENALMSNSVLPSLGKDIHLAILGASGGIARAMVTRLIEADNITQIYALSRSNVTYNHAKISAHYFDYYHENTLAGFADHIKDKPPLSLVLILSGFLYDDSFTPEKTYRELTQDGFRHVFEINAIGPAIAAKHLLPHMAKHSKNVFAALSARVGSLSDNRLGGWYSYRASKAALNMLIKTLSHEHRRKNKNGIIMGMHPGTVETQLSAPYRSNVPKGKLFTPVQSADYLLEVINKATPEHSGLCLDWKGEEILP